MCSPGLRPWTPVVATPWCKGCWTRTRPSPTRPVRPSSGSAASGPAGQSDCRRCACCLLATRTAPNLWRSQTDPTLSVATQVACSRARLTRVDVRAERHRRHPMTTPLCPQISTRCLPELNSSWWWHTSPLLFRCWNKRDKGGVSNSLSAATKFSPASRQERACPTPRECQCWAFPRPRAGRPTWFSHSDRAAPSPRAM